eukprot:jgi/Botrbrau1/6305/Bobra.0339s0016.1
MCVRACACVVLDLGPLLSVWTGGMGLCLSSQPFQSGNSQAAWVRRCPLEELQPHSAFQERSHMEWGAGDS